MATDETTFVTQLHPIDVGEVRDEGVQALVLLAASLGWNVLKKVNSPVVLTARDGTQKRLPTDSSCKMSVFQSALSTIMVHTADDLAPTVELMDKIVAEVKPSRDHERRLRLAVGETVAEHRKRLSNDKVAEQRSEPEEHLTQRIEVPDEDTSALREGLMVPWTPPADSENHGECISRETYKAHYSGHKEVGTGYAYESQTSYERIWEDGYVDYECQFCGKAYASARGVAAHRQTHTKAGELELDMRYMNKEYRDRQRARRAKQANIEFVDELPPEKLTAGAATEAIISGEPLVASADDIVSAIIKLVLPGLLADQDALINALVAERDEAWKRAAEIEGEFDALVELLTSRKKDK